MLNDIRYDTKESIICTKRLVNSGEQPDSDGFNGGARRAASPGKLGDWTLLQKK